MGDDVCGVCAVARLPPSRAPHPPPSSPPTHPPTYHSTPPSPSLSRHDCPALQLARVVPTASTRPPPHPRHRLPDRPEAEREAARAAGTERVAPPSGPPSPHARTPAAGGVRAVSQGRDDRPRGVPPVGSTRGALTAPPPSPFPPPPSSAVPPFPPCAIFCLPLPTARAPSARRGRAALGRGAADRPLTGARCCVACFAPYCALRPRSAVPRRRARSADGPPA